MGGVLGGGGGARLEVLHLDVVDPGGCSRRSRTAGARRRPKDARAAAGAVVQRDGAVSGQTPASLVVGILLLLLRCTPPHTHRPSAKAPCSTRQLSPASLWGR